MAHVPQARLFSWEDVESGSDLDRWSLALDYLPDDALMQALEARRAKGRDDYMQKSSSAVEKSPSTFLWLPSRNDRAGMSENLSECACLG
ncbi:hypothetical protein E4Q08_09410 [Candidatus Accumulibacter phosphatis]|uniref:Uncharacterized protein n=1 Tax=Candidatus Accumulibacter contiguus TaxID=2954381 RepID=A0ABX1T735_9PROT|nr:hypothetical protein [Candidatus Accumulibacter contiguus]NMQ05467.1 hypothetical protein [Candidatus Accumulibacter contiguus]